uniref:Uncharacterized protein n=1 Tax=Cacopsylla melanoneura TaxID=428564 RepID=A0A8D9B430_9HEMI
MGGQRLARITPPAQVGRCPSHSGPATPSLGSPPALTSTYTLISLRPFSHLNSSYSPTSSHSSNQPPNSPRFSPRKAPKNLVPNGYGSIVITFGMENFFVL